MQKKSPFKLNAENAALDFVNTLDDRFAPGGPRELLTGYTDLLQFCEQAGILKRSEIARLSAVSKTSQEASFHTTIELRELLARVFYRLIDGRGPSSDDRIALEGWDALCRKHRELRWEDDHLAWRWKGLSANPDAPALLLAELALNLLTKDPPAHLHVCASDTCRWLFLDTSKNRHAPLVRHENLRQPREGTPLQRGASRLGFSAA